MKKNDSCYKSALIILAILGTLGLGGCGGGGGDSSPDPVAPVDPPAPNPVPEPVPFNPAPRKMWIGYSADPGKGTQMYDVLTGAWMGQGVDNCEAKPVTMDVRPGDNVLMGMSADRKLMMIDTVDGRCQQLPLGALETAMNGQSVKGLAVNSFGVYAVLLDDGAQGRVVTFKLGDSTLASDTTLWSGLNPAPLDVTANAYGIDFKMLDYASTTEVENSKLIIAAHTTGIEMSHVLTYDAVGALTGSVLGAMQTGTAINSHAGDIVVNALPAGAGDRVYARTGWTTGLPGTIEDFNYVSSMVHFKLDPYYFNGVTTDGISKSLLLQGNENLTTALAARS